MKSIINRNIRWLIFGILLISISCSNQKNEVKVTYVANCGFLYENQAGKVLVDPFGTQFGNFFHLPSEQTIDNIIEGVPPFNNINLLLITHIHRDHFNPFLAEKFLLKNTGTMMFCPLQVYQEMKDSCQNFEQIDTQLVGTNLKMNESSRLTANNIPVRIIRMQHGTSRSLDDVDIADYTDYERTQNNGYIFQLGNKTVFHQGDGCLKINEEALNNIDFPVDIAHLSYFDWDTVSYNILKEKLHVKTVIFMHGTKPGKELQTEEFKNMEHDLTVFKEELESKIL